MKLEKVLIALLVIGVCACSDPKNATVPTSLEKMDTIKPQLEKLTAEERELFAGYAVRHTLGAQLGGAFGIKTEPIPEGMTIGKAIEEQREFIAKERAKEAEAKALKEKIAAEREKAMEQMRNAATVSLVKKGIDVQKDGYSGIVMDEKLIITVAFKNNTDKEIAGIKGTLDSQDIFGEELSGFNLSFDQTLKPGQTATWTGGRSVKFGMSSAKDRKFADLPDDKYKTVWKPQMIIFADGSKMATPSE